MQSKLYISFKKPSKLRRFFCFWLILLSINVISQPQLKFKNIKKNFGFVKKGEIVFLEYEFTNTGNQPIIITDAKVECSCTIVEFPKFPVAPNQTEKVMVKFDTKSVYDRQDRTVEIISNSKNAIQKIRFKGVVLK